MLNKHDENGYMCLIPDFKGKAFGIMYDVSGGFLIDVLYQVGKIFFFS